MERTPPPCSAQLSSVWVWTICTLTEDIISSRFPVPFPSPRLSQHDWRWAGEAEPACVSTLLSVLNNSACLFTCALLTQKQHPPVTLLLNTLMIMTSASPLALPACIKYWGIFLFFFLPLCMCACVNVSRCACKTERKRLRILILCVCAR